MIFGHAAVGDEGSGLATCLAVIFTSKPFLRSLTVSKIYSLICRALSVFIRKKNIRHGTYTIAYVSDCVSIVKSESFSVSDYKPETALIELCEYIKQKHQIQEFAIMNLVFFPK